MKDGMRSGSARSRWSCRKNRNRDVVRVAKNAVATCTQIQAVALSVRDRLEHLGTLTQPSSAFTSEVASGRWLASFEHYKPCKPYKHSARVNALVSCGPQLIHKFDAKMRKMAKMAKEAKHAHNLVFL